MGSGLKTNYIMANVIYNHFLKKMLSDGIDLLLKNTYRICLLRKSYNENSIPSPEDIVTYQAMNLGGFECKDTGIYSKTSGYQAGGELVELIEIENDKGDNSKEYYLKYPVQWEHCTLTGDNRARYAFLYRESDGMAIGCFDLGDFIDSTDDTLVIDWGDTPLIMIDSVDSVRLEVDKYLSLNSENSVQNKVITQTFIDFGVVISNESLPDVLRGMDSIGIISESAVDSLFEEE